MNENIHCLSFSDWLISLSILPSCSIHVKANGGYLSFLMAEEYSIVYINHIFIHSSLHGHWGSFHSLAIVDIAARNIGVQVSRRYIASVSLGPTVQLLGCREDLLLTLWGTFTQFSRVAAPVHIPTKGAGGLPFLHILSNIFGFLLC